MTIDQPTINAPYTTSLLVSNTASTRPDTFSIIVKAENGAYNSYDTSVLIIQSSDSIKWAHFTPSNSGLSAASVMVLEKDKLNKDIWMAQSDDVTPRYFLSRFSGYSWQTISTASTDNSFITDMCGNVTWNSTISSPLVGYVGCMYADTDKIWFGSGSYLKCLNRANLTPIIDTQFSATAFRQITRSTDGNMWFAGGYSYLWKYDGSSWINYNGTNSPVNFQVNAVAADAHNKIWIGTFGGLISFDGTFWNFYNTSNSAIPSNQVIKIKLDENGLPILWGDDILYRFDGINFDTISGATLGTGISLQVDSSTIWYSSNHQPLKSFDGTTTSIVSPSNMGVPVIDFSTTVVNDMIKDSVGNIWIATTDGLVVYNKNGLHDLFNSPRVLYNPVVASVPEYQQGNALNSDFIYPNPSGGSVKLAITLNKKETVSLKLIDSRGFFIKSWSFISTGGYQEFSFDISEYASGLYYLSIASNSINRSQKLVLTK